VDVKKNLQILPQMCRIIYDEQWTRKFRRIFRPPHPRLTVLWISSYGTRKIHLVRWLGRHLGLHGAIWSRSRTSEKEQNVGKPDEKTCGKPTISSQWFETSTIRLPRTRGQFQCIFKKRSRTRFSYHGSLRPKWYAVCSRKHLCWAFQRVLR
jgi:hypothetical protein